MSNWDVDTKQRNEVGRAVRGKVICEAGISRQRAKKCKGLKI